MRKPNLLLKHHLLMPIQATEARVREIELVVDTVTSGIIRNGLFVMLVSYMESMQKEALTYYLKYYPEKISREKSIEIEKNLLVEEENFRLVERVVSRYVERIPLRRLDELFQKSLGVSRPANSGTLAKIRSRRNQLVHRNLQIDLKQGRVAQVHVEVSDVRDAAREFLLYLSALNAEVSRRYAKHSRLNALRELWHYTFDTPLCSNFEDYWAIDDGKDALVGYKSPVQERSLSHGERFMLGIWRSQVSEYKVEFVNMSSLGGRMQSCLYMFLKLSNDAFLY